MLNLFILKVFQLELFMPKMLILKVPKQKFFIVKIFLLLILFYFQK